MLGHYPWKSRGRREEDGIQNLFGFSYKKLLTGTLRKCCLPFLIHEDRTRFELNGAKLRENLRERQA